VSSFSHKASVRSRLILCSLLILLQRLLAGVRTPLAGWYSGICVIVALYALTGAFYWIPNAALAAVSYKLSFVSFLPVSHDSLFHFQVIIHAVLDLVASPATVYSFWKVSPLEACIFMLAVIVSVFATIEIGIYESLFHSAFPLLAPNTSNSFRNVGFCGCIGCSPSLPDRST
jgi:MFS superfamily sulfate permease-like transporter